MFCNGFGGSYAGSNFFMMAIMLAVLLFTVYFAYKTINNKNLNLAVDTSSSKAMAILNERFARGEISEEEYEIKKSQILK
ncbi:putative membrane protein [Clostridium algifaecis]|uniref:Membrane protein n=1 Tax=Clostridium algifaecis TaxID=1472040 RepID=A0ABS4KVS2_9CLOT|nr:SHOCT domain-containing protein [Clostridium algifaecis]MBP2034107.1 putative membrane protein [Clostridium algifaecis]